jgi:predicted aspartyl protease
MRPSRTWGIPLAAVLASAGVQASPPVADACRLAREAQAGAPLQLPFELVDGRIYVQARVNGRGPYRFAVDTGASGMGRADASLVRALGLHVSGQVPNSDGVRTAHADTTRLVSLDLGGMVRRDVEVIARDYGARMPEAQRFHGIVGRDFFGDGMLVIDYPNRRLAFTTTTRLSTDARHALGYDRPFRVPVTIAGVPATGHLDTGANVAAVLPRSLYDRIAATPLEEAGTGQLSNGKIGIRKATVEGAIELSAVRVERPGVRVSDDFPELLIGAHLLQHHLLAIDQRSRRVALCAAAAD